MRIDEEEFTIDLPHIGTKVEGRLGAPGKDGRRLLALLQSTSIPASFLEERAEERKAGGRAPLGDSHGAWQKVAEVPLRLLLGKIPPDQWEDQKALAKLLNDPDYRAFRSDGDHRRF